MYGVKQSTATPYNPHGNPKCERFNWTLHDMLKTLLKSQKPNWPAHLNSLVFAYNAMPNLNTGLQPYQLMFGCKAQTPCNNWLGLNNYDSNEPVSKSSWLQEHHKLMQAMNQPALKNIKKKNRVLSEQGEKNCSSQRVIWSYCRIIPKVVKKSKTILKTKSLLWWNNSANLMCTKSNQSVVFVWSRL